MATIYGLGSEVDDAQQASVKERLCAEISPDTGGPLFTLAVTFSLLVFYAFATQSMNNPGRDLPRNKGWCYPLIQYVYMTATEINFPLLQQEAEPEHSAAQCTGSVFAVFAAQTGTTRAISHQSKC